MRLAIVYDRVNKFGGAEQVLIALHKIWPEAPLFTAVYNRESARWADVFEVKSSFLNSFPFAKKHHEFYPWATPFAFESFNFDEFDVVLSVTSAEAKSIVTKPETCHICYCLTPTRYLWSDADTYKNYPGFGILNAPVSTVLSHIIPTLRNWDKISASRPDKYIAISSEVKKRIETYYERKVDAIIYPPVQTDIYTIGSSNNRPRSLSKKYFLVVSRLVGYKRIDLIIQACNQLNIPLIVIGDGYERQNLEKIAGKKTQIISKKLTEKELTEYYQHCTAFIYAAQEDFGIVAAEAQSAGKPVIAYKKSGVSDIVEDTKTGLLFEEQTVKCIVHAIEQFQTMKFSPSRCRDRGLQFSYQVFSNNIKGFVFDAYASTQL